MTVRRTEGPTPHGGAYALGVWMNLEEWREVSEEDATGLVITEYTADGEFIAESVCTLPRA